MQTYISLAQIDEATKVVRKQTSYQPRVGMILGSGLNDLADSVQKADHIRYGDIPHFPVSTVPGHAGRFVIGELEVLCLSCRDGSIITRVIAWRR